DYRALVYQFGSDRITIRAKGTPDTRTEDWSFAEAFAWRPTDFGQHGGAGQPLPVGHSTQTTNRIWFGRADESQPEWVKKSVETTNRIWIGQPDGAANRSQPVRSETNRTSPSAGSGRRPMR